MQIPISSRSSSPVETPCTVDPTTPRMIVNRSAISVAFKV